MVFCPIQLKQYYIDAYVSIQIYSILSFMCMFCRSLFVLLHFYFWPLCCLFFFDIRVLITTLLSSTFSCHRNFTLICNLSMFIHARNLIIWSWLYAGASQEKRTEASLVLYFHVPLYRCFSSLNNSVWWLFWTQVLAKDKHFLFLIRHALYFSYCQVR